MEVFTPICHKLYNLTGIPITLTRGNGEVMAVFPPVQGNHLMPRALDVVLEDFRLQKRDTLHPLISYLEPGYFLGVCKLTKDLYAIIGLVSPTSQSRQEILSLVTYAVTPECIQQVCDLMLRLLTFSLDQVKDLICLLVYLTQGKMISKEQICFNDIFLTNIKNIDKMEEELFLQREKSNFHVPTADFESAICRAIEQGNKEDLMRILYSPRQGHVGKMSYDELRQAQYAHACLATLISRAAIRGGLLEETAFNMSDFYCQCTDGMRDVTSVEKMSFSMMLAFYEKVQEVRGSLPASMVIQKCLDYISVHLHNTISLEDLSQHCGLCSRSLSLRFKKEIGMGIPEYINRERIKEARYLLRHTNYTLSEISYFLNYPSQSYFTQTFKKYVGATPLQYREHRNQRKEH